jgi:hypothetical protein
MGGYLMNIDNTACSKLYTAIWEQALRDDISREKHRILTETTEVLFSAILKYQREQRATEARIEAYIKQEYGTHGIENYKHLLNRIKERENELVRAVKEKVLREAEKWPKNTKEKDKEYEIKYQLLKSQIIKVHMGVSA